MKAKNQFGQRDSTGKWAKSIRFAGTILSIVLLIWLLQKQNWQTIWTGMKSVSWDMILISLGLVLLRHIWHTVRWSFLLAGQNIRVPIFKLLRISFGGLFASNFLPGMIGGDVVRAAGILPLATGKKVAALTSLLMDRLLGFLSMLLVFPFSFPFLADFWKVFSREIGLGGIGARIQASAFLGIGINRILDKLKDVFGKVWAAVKLWIHKPVHLIFAFLFSMLGVISYSVAVWLIAQQLSIQVSLIDVFGATSVSYLLTLIPVSINGLGLRELIILGVYTQFGATPEQATALALTTRVIILCASLPGALTLSRVLEGKKILEDW